MAARPAFPLDRHVLAHVRMHWPLAIIRWPYTSARMARCALIRRK